MILFKALIFYFGLKACCPHSQLWLPCPGRRNRRGSNRSCLMPLPPAVGEREGRQDHRDLWIDCALSFCPIGRFPFSGTCSENLFCTKDSFCEPDIVLWAFYPVSNQREKVLFHTSMCSAYNSATIPWAFNKYSSRIRILTLNRK